MAELAPKVIFPRVVKHAMVCLAKPAFCTVTAEEVVIMNTPEGEIYNTSVLERLVCYLKLVTKSDFKFDCQLPGFLFRFFFLCSVKSSEAAKRQNMKKESKVYSYEDQIWEMELREVCCTQAQDHCICGLSCGVVVGTFDFRSDDLLHLRSRQDTFHVCHASIPEMLG